MKYFLLFTLFFYKTSVFAQKDTIINLNYGKNSVGIGMIEMANKQVYYLSNVNISQNLNRLAITKLDDRGALIWQRSPNETNNCNPECIIKNNDNSFFTAGQYYDTLSGQRDMFLAKLDTDANVIWFKTYDIDSKNELLEDICITKDEGIVGTGFITQNNSFSNDLLVVKFDKNGNLKWHYAYGGNKNDAGHSIRQNDNEEYIIAGDRQELSNDNYDIIVMKIDSSGEILWENILGIPFNNGSQQMLIDANKDIVVVGEGSTTTEELFKLVFIKIDDKGNILIDNHYEAEGRTAAFDICENDDGSYNLTGYSNANMPNEAIGAFIAKINSNGEPIGIKVFNNNTLNIGFDIISASKGGYYIAAAALDTAYFIHTYAQDLQPILTHNFIKKNTSIDTKDITVQYTSDGLNIHSNSSIKSILTYNLMAQCTTEINPNVKDYFIPYSFFIDKNFLLVIHNQYYKFSKKIILK